MLTTAGRACRTARTTGESRCSDISRPYICPTAAVKSETATTNSARRAQHWAQRPRRWARSGWGIGGSLRGKSSSVAGRRRHGAGSVQGASLNEPVIPAADRSMQATSAHRYHWLKRCKCRSSQMAQLLGSRLSKAFSQKVTATFCAKHPPGRSGKRWLSPFAAQKSGSKRPANTGRVGTGWKRGGGGVSSGPIAAECEPTFAKQPQWSHGRRHVA